MLTLNKVALTDKQITISFLEVNFILGDVKSLYKLESSNYMSHHNGAVMSIWISGVMTLSTAPWVRFLLKLHRDKTLNYAGCIPRCHKSPLAG